MWGGGLVEYFRYLLEGRYFFPKSVSGMVGVGLRRLWVRSESACVAVSFDEILGDFSVEGVNL